MMRKLTRKVKVGSIYVGGDSHISIQSMTNTDTRDAKNTLNQIKQLEEIGCDIIRCAVPDIEASEALKIITKESKIPVVADIHFDYKLALESIKNGVDALRINPGNIGAMERVKMVAEAAKEKSIPIRVGVNSGSLKKDILDKYGRVCPEALVESALQHVNILEKCNFNDIVISIKSSNVIQMIESYRLISEKVNYPLHLGVTEAGTTFRGTIKSSVGIGTLLAEGIGDTIRVSITGDPLKEIKIGKEILRSLGYVNEGIEFVSCPTCGRTNIDLISIAEEVEKGFQTVIKILK